MGAARQTEKAAIVWFRYDLRLRDNPALHAAVATRRPILCVYVFDETSAGLRELGGASRWWLHHSLDRLDHDLRQHGAALHIRKGPASRTMMDVQDACGAAACFWNRRYGAAERSVDDALAQEMSRAGVEVRTFNGALLREPDEVRTKGGGPYRVFSPYLRASLALPEPPDPIGAPKAINAADWPETIPVLRTEDLGLLPQKPDWAGGLRETWQPGETAARARLQDFFDDALPDYAHGRDRPALAATSRLSPHLRFGEISPGEVFHRARQMAERQPELRPQAQKFVAELVWRDFCHLLLSENPDIAATPINPAFAHFPYAEPSPSQIEAWRFGKTGYPIVDAGMRQLWRTGTMHNRVRMITASFLIKHLLADWRIGESWFWDTLCDADPASNPANWQWVAGSGADASPYFRIFNPVLQGEKFDPEGDYVRCHVPELHDMPARFIHKPWLASEAALTKAGVTLGTTYPRPIVDHDEARARALAALAKMRAATRD